MSRQINLLVNTRILYHQYVRYIHFKSLLIKILSIVFFHSILFMFKSIIIIDKVYNDNNLSIIIINCSNNSNYWNYLPPINVTNFQSLIPHVRFFLTVRFLQVLHPETPQKIQIKN